MNTKTNLFVHASDSWIPKIEPFIFPQEEWRPPEPDRRIPASEFARRLEINASTSFTSFRVLLHCTSSENSVANLLKGGSVVRLQHTELGGFITAGDADFTNDELSEAYLRRNRAHDGDEFEAKSSNDLFEVELLDTFERGRVCNWSEKGDGEASLYRFRHLNTGSLLTAQTVTVKGKQMSTLGLSRHVNIEKEEECKLIADSTVFEIKSTTVESDERIIFGSCVKLKHHATGKHSLYLSNSIF